MIKISENIPLKDHSNYKIGGNASYFLEVNSKEDLVEGLTEWKKLDLKKKIFVLGRGTNILISDKGFDGFVIKNNIKGIKKENDLVLAFSGSTIEELNKFTIENSLTGFEWAGGLPGTIGGAVRGNAGAFDGETKESVLSVKSLDLETLEEKNRTRNECEFEYRNSIFKKNNDKEFILSVLFKFENGNKEEIEENVARRVVYRKERHPLEYPNIGSTFKNIPWEKVPEKFRNDWKIYIKNDPFEVMPVAKIIFLAGLKGIKFGNAMISEKHTNFIVNLGGATSEDVKKVIEDVKKVIFEKYGIKLEEEIMYLG